MMMMQFCVTPKKERETREAEKIVENLLSLGNAKRRKLITSCPASQH